MNTAAVSETGDYRVFVSPLHGTRYRYQTGCRCRPCVEANYAYKRAWEAERRARGQV